MILRIGNKGFALIEVMVTVSLLSLGATMIYQSNLMSLKTYGRSENLLSLQGWAEEKIWEDEEEILQEENPEARQAVGLLPRGNKFFHWQLKRNLLWQSEDSKLSFYQIECTVSWREGREERNLFRVRHVKKKKE